LRVRVRSPCMEDTHLPDSSPAARLSWVRKSDGRLVPFEPDQISRDLFAATERLGDPNAFLARELTDSVLHFLSLETESAIPTTTQILDVVVKVVRELGHPQLAQAFADRADSQAATESAIEQALGPSSAEVSRWLETAPSPRQLHRQVSRTILRDYSLKSVFTRDLAAAHASGLLCIGNLDLPLELAGLVLGPPDIAQLAERLLELRELAGEVVALDSPEYALSDASDPNAAAVGFVRELRLGLAGTGFRAVVNLNSNIPPTGTDALAEGPLFAAERKATEPAHRQAVADAIRDHLLSSSAGLSPQSLRIDWHLGEADLVKPANQRLLAATSAASHGLPIAFVFDRSRRPVALAEGLDRHHTSILMSIGLNLPGLIQQASAVVAPDALLGKLGSLVRLAFSAASQKRNWLRRHSTGRPLLTEGFRLDRARLVLVPIGLDSFCRRLAESTPGVDKQTPLPRQVIQQLRRAMQDEAGARCLEACLDSSPGFLMNEPGENEGSPSPQQAAGLTGWDASLPPRHQLKAASLFHAETKTGTAAIVFPADHHPTPDELADLLRAAWQSDICRLQFVQLDSPRRQLPALFEG
jgi:hypothetical protein